MATGIRDTTTELIEVVDTEDRVLGCLPRIEVHARGLRHRAAHVLVFNPAGEALIQRRAYWKECQPGLWDTSAAGHLAPGEAYEAAAARELAEELGLRPEMPLVPLCRIAAGPETGQEFVAVYRALVNAPPIPDPAEVMALRWCEPQVLENWLAAGPARFTQAFRRIWACHRAQAGTG